MRRHRIGAANILTRLARMTELGQNAERDMLLQWELNEAISSEYETIAMEVAELVTPTLEAIEHHFYPDGYETESAANPQGVLFLVSESIMAVPWEALPWTDRLFGHRSAKVYRDLSLHCQHWRMRNHLEVSDASWIQLPGDGVMLSDPYAEDAIRSTEPQDSETMHDMVQRLKKDSVREKCSKLSFSSKSFRFVHFLCLRSLKITPTIIKIV